MTTITLSDDDLQALLKALEDAVSEHLAMDMEYGGDVKMSLEQADEAHRLHDLLQGQAPKPKPAPVLTGVTLHVTVKVDDRTFAFQQAIPLDTYSVIVPDTGVSVTLIARPVYSTPATDGTQ